MPRLIILGGQELPPQAFDLLEKEVTVGSEEDNAIHLPQDNISGHHLKLEWYDGDYKVIDLHSTNGTFVNEEPVEEGILRNGDIVQLAGLALYYESHVYPPEENEEKRAKEDRFVRKAKYSGDETVLPQEKNLPEGKMLPSEELKVQKARAKMETVEPPAALASSKPVSKGLRDKMGDFGSSFLLSFILFMLAFSVGSGVFYLIRLMAF